MATLATWDSRSHLVTHHLKEAVKHLDWAMSAARQAGWPDHRSARLDRMRDGLYYLIRKWTA